MYYDKERGRWCEIGKDDVDEAPDLAPPPISKPSKPSELKLEEVKRGIDALLVPPIHHPHLRKPPAADMQAKAAQKLHCTGRSGSIPCNPQDASAHVAILPGDDANVNVGSSADAATTPPNPDDHWLGGDAIALEAPPDRELTQELDLKGSLGRISRYHLVQLLGLLVVVVKVLHIGVKGASLGQGMEAM